MRHDFVLASIIGMAAVVNLVTAPVWSIVSTPSKVSSRNSLCCCGGHVAENGKGVTVSFRPRPPALAPSARITEIGFSAPQNPAVPVVATGIDVHDKTFAVNRQLCYDMRTGTITASYFPSYWHANFVTLSDVTGVC